MGVSFFLIMILVFAIWSHPAQATPLISLNARYTKTPNDCPSIITGLLENQQARADLLNPVLIDKAQIELNIDKLSSFQACIKELPEGEISAALRTIDNLSQYFLVFAGGTDINPVDSRLELVDLGTTNDPAVRLLRESIDLPPPPGLVFVRYYSSRQTLPEIIRPAFRDPQVAGVTIFAKYIAILDEQQKSWAEQTLKKGYLPDILSHELVHAYVNGVEWNVSSEGNSEFPIWFEEGLATYLSKSGKLHTIITPNFSISETTTKDYLNYQLIFQYLESKQGKQKLYEAIHDTLIQGDISHLYRSYDLPSEAWLNSLAQEWDARKIRQRTTFGITLLGLAAIGVFLLLPEFQCECGYSGSKRSFLNGRCPMCGQSFENSQRHPTAHSPFLVIDSCQICKKRFWPWQDQEFHNFKRWVRVWIKNPNGAIEPIPRFVSKICDGCLQQSRSIESAHQQYVDAQIPILVNEYRRQIKSWLVNAPTLLNPTSPEWQVISLELMVNYLVWSAIKEKFGIWAANEPELKFAVGQIVNQSIDPPDIVIKNTYSDAITTNDSSETGTPYYLDPGQVVIEWHPAA